MAHDEIEELWKKILNDDSLTNDQKEILKGLLSKKSKEINVSEKKRRYPPIQ